MCNALTVTKRESAPLPERPCEQLTCCEKNGSVPGNYINRADKRHNCRITGKTKATCYGGHSTQATRYPQRMSIANNATFAAGGQCDQCAGLLVGYSCSLASPCCDVFQVCDPIFVRLYSLRNFSRWKVLTLFCSASCSAVMPSSEAMRRITRSLRFRMVYSLLTALRLTSSQYGADSDYSDSLALRRWRRLISPSSAETINCPVLSPSSFKFSTASAIAWGTRASSFLDFPLTAFVAISDLLVIRWLTVYTQENGKTLLTWLTPVTSIVADTFIEVIDEKTKPAGATNTNGLLTTNDNDSIEVAMLNHTTHPQGRDSHNLNKYIWRFIALSTAQPRVIHIEATSEQEARQQSPDGCVMVFAARIRQEVRHVQ
ncbi:host cell division inhibitor Icd-like protein [Escherichia coli]|nr:host cell division inhibitor Icd-like protein [Escherichia coli]